MATALILLMYLNTISSLFGSYVFERWKGENQREYFWVGKGKGDTAAAWNTALRVESASVTKFGSVTNDEDFGVAMVLENLEKRAKESTWRLNGELPP